MNRVKKYLKVWFRLVKLEIITDMQYRLNLLFGFLGTSAWLACELLFIHFLLQRYDTIAGWNEYQIGLLVGTNQLWVGGAFYLIIWPSLVSFFELVKYGDSDKLLTFPIKTRFYISIHKMDFSSLSILFNGLIILIYCLLKLGISLTLMNIICYVFLLSISIWIIYCIQFIVMCAVFWFTEVGSVLYIINAFDRFSRFPYEILGKGTLLIIFTFVIPIMIISNVPVRALVGILDIKYAFYSVIVAVIFTIISNVIWKMGLKRYESASS